MAQRPKSTAPEPVLAVAIYARVSTVGQVDGTSIASQLEDGRREIARRGWNAAGEYVDAGISGVKESRPQLDKLLAAVDSGQVQVVLVAKLDRLGRSQLQLVKILNRLTKAGCSVAY